MRTNNLLTSLLVMFILIFIFRFLWPVILFAAIGILVYSWYLRYKLTKSASQGSINEKYDYDSWSNNFENKKNDSVDNDIIDVVYTEHKE